MKISILFAIFISLLGSAAFAGTLPLYSRTTVKIIPAKVSVISVSPQENKEKQEPKKAVDSKISDFMPGLRRVAKEFAVDVRPTNFLEQRDFMSIQPFKDNEGMLLVIDPPEAKQLKSNNLLGKVDILFVDVNGSITQIAPDISLADLDQPLQSEKTIHGILFLKAGTAKEDDIVPGDKVENSLFKSQPIILQ